MEKYYISVLWKYIIFGYYVNIIYFSVMEIYYIWILRKYNIFRCYGNILYLDIT